MYIIQYITHVQFYFINYRLIMQCSISIICCHYYYYSLTYKTVIMSIAHVMKKQEVRFTSAHAQCLGKPNVSY